MTDFNPQFSGMFAVQHPDLVQPCRIAVITDVQKQVCEEVSRYWNHALTPGTDYTERWKLCQPGDVAVCHDYAVTKLNDLVQRAIPRGALALAWCKAEFGYHMVLFAKCEDGIYVLDSLTDEVFPIADVSYTWMGQEEFGNPQSWGAVQ